MESFWQNFQLKASCKNSIKIIIGQEPYKQSLNNITFNVVPIKSRVAIYNDLNNIAFLVSEWIKIQDSLEMIFNLLFGSSLSIEAISYLKKHSITPQDFAESLYYNANILLLNRMVRGQDKQQLIINFIEGQTIQVHTLFVGKKSLQGFRKSTNLNKNSALAIHPSGVNLNNHNQKIRYADNWYTCIGDQLNNVGSNFDFNEFKILLKT